MNAWHAQPLDLEAYRSGTAAPVLVASVESHLLGCATCRDRFARTADPASAAESARRWAALNAALDSGTATPALRLAAATRPLVAAFGLAVALLVVLPLGIAALAGTERVPTPLLAGAPLAPMVAVVLAYRREADPVGELSLAAPAAGIRMVAGRALLVSCVAGPLGVLAALVVGVPAAVALAWLLPGLALSGVVLAVGTSRLDPAVVAAVLGTVWAVAVGVAARRNGTELVVDLVTAAPVQYGCLLAAVLAFAVAVLRRDRLAYRRTL
ncbi:hypothetical protein [Nocardioides insulae]|uniref:hypothetical protein n=1 Tax=Nocardioides insulae TaxID=394734 RepID=UPI0003FBCF0F|nr:hypothetical protein [Nocardioides insulae]